MPRVPLRPIPLCGKWAGSYLRFNARAYRLIFLHLNSLDINDYHSGARIARRNFCSPVELKNDRFHPSERPRMAIHRVVTPIYVGSRESNRAALQMSWFVGRARIKPRSPTINSSLILRRYLIPFSILYARSHY